MIINNALYKFAERSHVMYLTTIITVHAVELHLSIKNKDKIVVPQFLPYDQDMQNSMAVKVRRPKREEYVCDKDWYKS